MINFYVLCKIPHTEKKNFHCKCVSVYPVQSQILKINSENKF